MATILDIAGKPMDQRKRSRNRWKAQDLRDLTKVAVMLLLVVIGYTLFAPDRDAAAQVRVITAQKAS